MKHKLILTRRSVLARAASFTVLATAIGTRLARAAGTRLASTPSQTEGPFYPVRKPDEISNDLIHVGGATAEGAPLQLVGRVLNTDGFAVPGAKVEIWQADQRGIYRHPRAPNQGREDPAFNGFGESSTNQDGRYAFLTIVPVPYSGRPPHIHVKVWVGQQEILTTQLYLKGHPDNDRDGLLSMLLFRNKKALMIDPRQAVIGSGLKGHAAAFDLVI